MNTIRYRVRCTFDLGRGHVTNHYFVRAYTRSGALTEFMNGQWKWIISPELTNLSIEEV